MAASASARTTSERERPPRHTVSKYDFVKVRVWLGENADHYYVLSRFLVSRALTVTKIPSVVAVKIALELKKLLIDLSLLDVSQKDLEENLFKLMQRRGYGDEYVRRYKMVTNFHHQRIPLIIIVCGAPCTGKSTIASQLAQRLNLPNVLQTGMVYDILRTSPDAPLNAMPIWGREFATPEDMVVEFVHECRVVLKGLQGDLNKALKDGKPIIIEGSHLDPEIFLDWIMETPGMCLPSRGPNPVGTDGDGEEEGNLRQTDSQDDEQLAGFNAPGPVASSSSQQQQQPQQQPLLTRWRQSVMRLIVQRQSEKEVSVESTSHVEYEAEVCYREGPASGVCSTSCSNVSFGSQGAARPHQEVSQSAAVEDRERPKAIVVPVVLRMNKDDHRMLLGQRISQPSDGQHHFSDGMLNKMVEKANVISDHLTSFQSPGLAVVDVSIATFPRALDILHTFLLQVIEEVYTTSMPQ